MAVEDVTVRAASGGNRAGRGSVAAGLGSSDGDALGKPNRGGDVHLVAGKGGTLPSGERGEDGAVILDGRVEVVVPGHGRMSLDDYVAFSVARLVGPGLAGVLADWLEDGGRPAEAARLRALAAKADQR